MESLIVPNRPLVTGRGAPMDVKIQAQGMKVSDSLDSYIRERVDRLEKFEDRTIDAKFEIRADRVRSGDPTQYIAQFTIATPGNILRAEAREHDERAAVDKALDKMKRQIRRYHSRRVDRSKHGAKNLGRLAAEQAGNFDGPLPDSQQPLVRTKRFELRPMDVDEAIEQMELLEHDFFLFLNTENGNTNVVYRRNDGAYGLIVPDVG